jgi:hypothetical protein
LQRFADFSRAAVIGFAVATLFVFVLWGAYQVLDDERDPASYGGRQHS